MGIHSCFTVTYHTQELAAQPQIMLGLLYRRESILAIVVFPCQNNKIVQCVFGELRPCGNWKFLAVHRVDLMTHVECRVDRPFPNHAIR